MAKTGEFRSQKDVKDFLYKNGFILKSKYDGAKNYVVIKDFDGYFYRIKFFSLQWNIQRNYGKQFNPLRFAIFNPYTMQNIVLWLKINKKNFSLVKGKWIGNSEKTLFFKCKKCKRIWDVCWSSINAGHGCPYCTNNRLGDNTLRKNRPDLAKEWNYNRNGELTPDNIAHQSNKSVWWICKFGHEWEIEVSNRNGVLPRNRTNCPFCKSSKGEIRVSSFLEKSNIEFFRQKRFDGCVYKRRLAFDFYIPSLNLCIEYQGVQHFEPRNYKKDKKEQIKMFEEIVFKDNIKRKFCEERKINLLEISYWEFDNIEKILTKVFNL